MVCTHTLYNEVWAGKLSLTATELPEALKRKQHKASLARENKKNYGNGISERPEIAALRIEEGLSSLCRVAGGSAFVALTRRCASAQLVSDGGGGTAKFSGYGSV